MRAELVRSFRIDAAHRLPKVPKGHKCGRIHGHGFRIEVAIEGPVGAESGWVLDYADIDAAFKPIHDTLDHNFLNEVEGLENPTSELLAAWIFGSLVKTLPGLVSVAVEESCQARCVYRGES
jgi:6-pyruvoyltetrahydropterin/6-carboxytetrahydropterin synthase